MDKMKRTGSAVTTAMFCLFLCAMAGLTFLLPKRTFSQQENRNLAQPPKLTVQTISNGRFMKDAESWISDHVVLRDQWVQLKAVSERISGKRENNGVFFCEKDTLIKRVEEPDAVQAEKNMGAVRGFPAKVDGTVYFGLIPTAASVWSDRLPAGAPTLDEEAWIGKLYDQFPGTTVDIAGALNGHRDEDVFYRTDHHWTTLGARYAADTILEAMGLPALREEELETTVVSDGFYGTVYSRSGAWWVHPDRIETMVSPEGTDVTSNFHGEDEEGSLYVSSWLNEKNKYAYFLGGNQPVCVIRTRNDGPKILLVRDSYSDSLAPFLSLRFSEIHLIDLRYYRLAIPAYMKEHDIDSVLVLYGLSSFLEDPNLYLLKR